LFFDKEILTPDQSKRKHRLDKENNKQKIVYPMTTSLNETLIPFAEFISSFRQTLKNAFYERNDIKKFIRHSIAGYYGH